MKKKKKVCVIFMVSRILDITHFMTIFFALDLKIEYSGGQIIINKLVRHFEIFILTFKLFVA